MTEYDPGDEEEEEEEGANRTDPKTGKRARGREVSQGAGGALRYLLATVGIEARVRMRTGWVWWGHSRAWMARRGLKLRSFRRETGGGGKVGGQGKAPDNGVDGCHAQGPHGRSGRR